MNRVEKIKFIKERLEFCQRIDKDYRKRVKGYDASIIQSRIRRRASLLTMLRDDPNKTPNLNKFTKIALRLTIDATAGELYAMYHIWVRYARDAEDRIIYYDPIIRSLRGDHPAKTLDYSEYGL